MSEKRASWPKRFIRWLFGGPFQDLPPQYGNLVPPDLQEFEAVSANANRHGFGRFGRSARARHAKTVAARQENWLERQ